MNIWKWLGSVFYSLTLTSLVACGGGGGEEEMEANGCNDLFAKITGGAACRTDNTPVVVVLPVVFDGDKPVPIGFCTGTIVTNDDVLTAAHCLTGEVARRAEGYFVITGNKGVFPVIRTAYNPLYNRGEAFDTGMVTISGNFGIAPMPINISDTLNEGEQVTVYGYGNDKEEQSFLEKGLDSYKAGRMIVKAAGQGVFLAFFNDTGAAICQGDSGGPVVQVINGVPSIVGVTSVTFNGCVTDSASGFVSMQSVGNVEFVNRYAPDVKFR